jgi:hypothetical protein
MNYSCYAASNEMRRWLSESDVCVHADRRTGKQRDRQTDRQTCGILKITSVWISCALAGILNHLSPEHETELTSTVHKDTMVNNEQTISVFLVCGEGDLGWRVCLDPIPWQEEWWQSVVFPVSYFTMWKWLMVGTWLCTLHTYDPFWCSIIDVPNDVNISDAPAEILMGIPICLQKVTVIYECTHLKTAGLKHYLSTKFCSTLC